MSPPFIPPPKKKGAKGCKATGGCCCIYRKGVVVWLSREGLFGNRQCRAILTGLKAYGVKGHGPFAKHEISFMTNAFADDDRNRKRHLYRGGSEKNVDDNDDNDRNGYLKPVTNQTYKEACGACHFAYQPELLPSASWLKILNQLDDHFGEEVEADPDTIKTISDYLKTNGAENVSAKRSKKIMRSLGNQVPMRISDIPYIREKHHELDPAIFKRESVGSLANCAACHITAEKGIYDDDDVKIPK